MFMHTATKDVTADTDLYSYKPNELQADIRVQCNSAKYPWIIQAHRFRHEQHKPGEVDTAYFSFPPTKGDGHYVVYYHWSGYKDCIDVDVTSETVTNKYGVLTDDELYERIDHCAFEYAQK